MKILHINTERTNEESKLKLSDFSVLPKDLVIAYSLQFESLAIRIVDFLKKNSYNIDGPFQVLGCSKLKASKPILLIGSGKFHALNLALKNPFQIYIYNSGVITELDKRNLEKLKEKKKASFSKFLNSENVGIIISTKPGQNNQNLTKLMQQKTMKNKKSYLFLSSQINLNELENFDIDVWINTACPGIFNDADQINIINLEDLLEYLE